MSSGYPDWETRFIKSEISIKPNLLFKTGTVIYYDIFDSPSLAWNTGGVGSEEIYLKTVYTFSPSACIYMGSGQSVNDTAYIQKVMGITETEKIGVEFAVNEESGHGYFTVEVDYYDGTIHYSSGIRYVATNYHWQYKNSVGNFTDLINPEKYIYSADYGYHIVKLIANFDTGKYIKLNVDEQEWDLSSYSMQTSAAIVNIRLEIKFTVETIAPMQRQWARIDNISIISED